MDPQYFDYPFKKPGTLECLSLTNTHTQLITAISAKEIHQAVFKSIENNIEMRIRDLFLHNFTKIRTALLVKEVIFDHKHGSYIYLDWLILLLYRYGEMMNYKILVLGDNKWSFLKIKSSHFVEGAGRKMLEKIKTADAIMPPKLIRRNSSNDETSLTAIFSDAHPSIIVHIGKNLECITYTYI
jgi:hypothetical protein